MEPRFERALGDLQLLLLESARDLQIPIHFALIGGLALSAWGVVRATADIDLLAHSNPSPLRDPDLRVEAGRWIGELETPTILFHCC
jgi:hypothetical protein